MNGERLSWTEYFMSVAEAISQRSSCNRGKPGCVFVKDNQILATGYAGSPPGLPHCDDIGHQFEARFVLSSPAEKPDLEKGWSTHCVRTTHAEMNAIIQAARRGTALEGSTVYVTMTPCRDCTKALITVGVKEVVANKLYQKAQESLSMFEQAGIKVTHLDQTVQEYK